MKMFSVPFLLLPLLVACGGSEAPKAVEPPPAAEGAAPAAPEAAPAAAAPAEAAAAPSGDSAGCEGLSAYEGFVDEYIKAIEGMAGGNPAAAGSLIGLQSQAQKAGESLAKLKPGTDCYTRFIGIQQKMTQAALKMNKAGAGAAAAAAAAAAPEAMKQLEKANSAVSCMQKCNSMSDPMAKISCIQGCQ
jgi:hypothetical protein